MPDAVSQTTPPPAARSQAERAAAPSDIPSAEARLDALAIFATGFLSLSLLCTRAARCCRLPGSPERPERRLADMSCSERKARALGTPLLSASAAAAPCEGIDVDIVHSVQVYSKVKYYRRGAVVVQLKTVQNEL